MKKNVFISVLLLVVAIIAVSCTQDKVQDDLVSIRFSKLRAKAIDDVAYSTTGDASWESAVDILTSDKIYWAYKATKKDNAFTNGQTTGFVAWSESANLTGSKKFSPGKWEFEFKAYISADERANSIATEATSDTAIYKSGTISVDTNATGFNKTVAVPVTYTYIEGVGVADFEISTTITQDAVEGSNLSSYYITKVVMLIDSKEVELIKDKDNSAETKWTKSEAEVTAGVQTVGIKVYVDGESTPRYTNENLGTAIIMHGMTTNIIGTATIALTKQGDVDISFTPGVPDSQPDSSGYGSN